MVSMYGGGVVGSSTGGGQNSKKEEEQKMLSLTQKASQMQLPPLDTSDLKPESSKKEDKKSDQEDQKQSKSKFVKGSIEIRMEHDKSQDADVDDDFSFQLRFRATYPALCSLVSWDPQSTYLRKIVAKVKKQKFDIELPLTRVNFQKMCEQCTLTDVQKQNLQDRIQKVMTAVINQCINRLDPNKKAKATT